MGYGYCRFECGHGTNIDYMVQLKELDIILQICGMWRHYAECHNVQPKKEVRRLIMGEADIDVSKLPKMEMGGIYTVPVLFVEKVKGGVFRKEKYTHEIGNSPNTEFIDKLQNLIDELGQEVLYTGL